MPFVVDGSVKKSVREAILDEVRTLPPEKEFVLIATGQYLGEGFDCPQADTLFLTFPISFKGKLIQYLGRIMRPYPGKTVAQVYDYDDVSVPVLRHMHLRRSQDLYLTGCSRHGHAQRPGHPEFLLMFEPPDALRSDLGLVRTNRSIEADAAVIKRSLAPRATKPELRGRNSQ